MTDPMPGGNVETMPRAIWFTMVSLASSIPVSCQGCGQEPQGSLGPRNLQNHSKKGASAQI